MTSQIPTHFAVSVKYDEPSLDDFAFVVVAAVEQLHIVVAPQPVHSHFSFAKYKSMYDCR